MLLDAWWPVRRCRFRARRRCGWDQVRRRWSAAMAQACRAASTASWAQRSERRRSRGSRSAKRFRQHARRCGFRSSAQGSLRTGCPRLSSKTAEGAVRVIAKGDNDPQPTTADAFRWFRHGLAACPATPDGEDVRNRAEAQQVLLLDADAETGVGFDQDFVEAKRIDADILHQPGFRRDGSRISAGDAMQDLDQTFLQLLLFRDAPPNPMLLLVWFKISALPVEIHPVPAEVLVDRLWGHIDEEFRRSSGMPFQDLQTSGFR